MLCRRNVISNHYGARQIGWRKHAAMTFFDPLDREIFERALEAAHAAVKENLPRDALDSDEALEHALRRELIDIALTAGISDAETLCDFALQAFEQGRLAP
jgi:hypothetical protein